MNLDDMDKIKYYVSTPIFVIDDWLVNPTDNIDLVGQTQLEHDISMLKKYIDKIDPSNQTTFEYDISTLKKYIKHAKTPLEKKRYEKMLNNAYKQRKGRVHDGKTKQVI